VQPPILTSIGLFGNLETVYEGYFAALI